MSALSERYAQAAVTGVSIRTPLGNEPALVLSRLLVGERGAEPNRHFDARSYPCHLAATIPSPPKPTKHRKFVKRMGLYGMEAGQEALARSGIAIRGPRLGLFCGYGGLRAHWDDLMPVLEKQEGDERASGAWANGFSLLHPFWMLFHLSNNAHALLSIDISAKGDGTTVAGSNASAQALEAAIRSLTLGAVDAALVFTYDSLVEPETILSLGMAKALTSTSNVADLASPYDAKAAGFVPGEAACAVVLERVEDAGPRALAKLSACAVADGADGFPSIALVERAFTDVWQGETIVDGVSLADPSWDQEERVFLAKQIGEQATLLSTTSALGQLGGATTLMQAILLTEILNKGELPPVAGLATATAGPCPPLSQAKATNANAAVALSVGMPGLCGAVRVERA